MRLKPSDFRISLLALIESDRECVGKGSHADFLLYLFGYARSLQRHRDDGLCDSPHLGLWRGAGLVSLKKFRSLRRGRTRAQCAFVLFGPESGVLLREISER